MKKRFESSARRVHVKSRAPMALLVTLLALADRFRTILFGSAEPSRGAPACSRPVFSRLRNCASRPAREARLHHGRGATARLQGQMHERSRARLLVQAPVLTPLRSSPEMALRARFALPSQAVRSLNRYLDTYRGVQRDV
jgi:hypothetical protein